MPTQLSFFLSPTSSHATQEKEGQRREQRGGRTPSIYGKLSPLSVFFVAYILWTQTRRQKHNSAQNL